jgi:hypothetical protein
LPRRWISRTPLSRLLVSQRLSPTPCLVHGMTALALLPCSITFAMATPWSCGVLGSLAEYERELVKERTALKRAMSLANGTKFGRRKKIAEQSHIATARRMKDDGHTARDVAKYLGVSRATLYRYLTDEAA